MGVKELFQRNKKKKISAKYQPGTKIKFGKKGEMTYSPGSRVKF